MSAEENKDEIYEDYDETAEDIAATEHKSAADTSTAMGYSGTKMSSFRDFLLKPELLRAITDHGFEHPSEVQQQAIPQAILGGDVICQAKSGMGKTAVFVLATLQQLNLPAEEVKNEKVDTVVLAHTREMSVQIKEEYERFSKYLYPRSDNAAESRVKISCFYGGVPVKGNIAELKKEQPHIVVGTPGRVFDLCQGGPRRGNIKLEIGSAKRFIMDECDRLMEAFMRPHVQKIFKMTPRVKQVMMFSATLAEDVRETCKKFTDDPVEIYVDEAKLTLFGLHQYYIQLEKKEKNRKLLDLLDNIQFNQVVIFVNRPNDVKEGNSGARRAKALNQLLTENNFPSNCVYGSLKQEQRLEIYKGFKEFESRILVSTDVMGRGVDFERVNVVINYDMPPTKEDYLHRVGRSGRFGTKGLAISFISSKEDSEVMNQVQAKFLVEIPECPEVIDASNYESKAQS